MKGIAGIYRRTWIVMFAIGMLMLSGIGLSFADSPGLLSGRTIDTRHSPVWMIAFERGKGIWTAHGDGTAQKRIIANGYHPCWSPDKKQLAFERNDDVWLAHADGSHQRQLTHHRPGARRGSQRNYDPWTGIHITWNRKYNLITFSHSEDFTSILQGSRKKVSIGGSSLYDIWPQPTKQSWGSVNPSPDPGIFTSNVSVRLSSFSMGTGSAFSNYGQPAWSHSGRTLAFSCNGDIWMMYNVTDEQPLDARFHTWQWECGRLAAVATYDTPNYRASRMNIVVSRISWSPDERYLAYSLTRCGGSGFEEVHLLEVGKKALTTGIDLKLSDFGKDPCFSPDGKSLAYWGYDPADPMQSGIWVISLDGKKQTLLIRDAGYPTW